MTPRIINVREATFKTPMDSLNQNIPTIAIKAIFTPGQVAYAALTSIRLMAKATATKLRP